ncbi:hypothetical protein ONZ45_g8482 [Pleurotus djamor]|nr:hypothetical protein ONZ45_g8482 [Pleurotus djamor]
MHPDDLDALLHCPLCHSRLKNPTTIRCGHTLCGGHVHTVTSRCPIASCSRDDSSSSQNISSSSRVLIRHSQQPPPHIPGLNRRPDVVVNKLLALCQTATDVAVTPSSDADDDDDERPSILKAFPDKYAARAETINAEERDSRLDTPIFVCQLSFPGIPTVLHFFEPRYRLMLRRCLDSPNPCFGMVMPPRSGTGSSPSAANAGVTMEFGTMLEIRSVQMLSDGRSMVETWGTHRFRIMEKGVLDGYVVGRVERVDDYDSDFDDDEEDEVQEAFLEDVQPHGAAKSPVPLVRQTSSTSSTTSTTSSSSGSTSNNSFLSRIASTLSPPRSSPSSSPTVYKSPFGPSIPELMEACKSFLGELQQGTAPWVVQRMNDAYGPPPTDPSSFSFWVALVLPIEETEKAKLLPIRSIRLRLRVVVGWIEQLRVTWWFTSGCTVL